MEIQNWATLYATVREVNIKLAMSEKQLKILSTTVKLSFHALYKEIFRRESNQYYKI